VKRDEEQLLREAVDDFLYVLALLVLSPLLIARWAWIVKMNGDPRVPPRDKQMNEIQLNYAMKVLQRARDRWAEEAVKLWTSASQSPQAT